MLADGSLSQQNQNHWTLQVCPHSTFCGIHLEKSSVFVWSSPLFTFSPSFLFLWLSPIFCSPALANPLTTEVLSEISGLLNIILKRHFQPFTSQSYNSPPKPFPIHFNSKHYKKRSYCIAEWFLAQWDRNIMPIICNVFVISSQVGEGLTMLSVVPLSSPLPSPAFEGVKWTRQHINLT